MFEVLRVAGAMIRDAVRSRLALALENAFLRKQVEILRRRREGRALHTTASERVWLYALSRVTADWRSLLHVVDPETLLEWRRRGYRAFWTFKSRHRRSARRITPVLRALIVEMALRNPLWGAEKIASEILQKLKIPVSTSSVKRVLRRLPRRPRRGQSWPVFVRNHLNQILACDFFTTTTWSFRQIYVLFFLKLDTREVVHWAASEHPTREWTTQQLREATAWCRGPRFLIRDRDDRFGPGFDDVARACGTRVLRTPVRTPVANAYAERLVGSIRRECLDHLCIRSQRSLEAFLREYFDYYNSARPHQALERRVPREVYHPRDRPSVGSIARRPVLGGLHHDYFRLPA